MSRFVLTDEGIVLNKTAAAEGRIPLAAWDIGSNNFLSTQPDTDQCLPPHELTANLLEGKWRLVKAPSSEQIWVEVDDVLIGQVNRRAAAILAPLLDGDLIYVEVQQNQEAEGRSSKALYIFAKLGVRGNKQMIQEPSTTREMRAYIALLACTMKALKALEAAMDRDWSDEEPGDEEPNNFSSWHKLPGAVEWDFATGSVGNTVSQDLIDQLGSRTLAALKRCGAPMIKPRGKHEGITSLGLV